jgi:hydrogenase maturation factor
MENNFMTLEECQESKSAFIETALLFHERIKKLEEALRQIEQMSDCGSYEKSIVKMKSIATDALKH